MYIQLTSPLSHSQFLDWIGIIFQVFISTTNNQTQKASKKENGRCLHMVTKDVDSVSKVFCDFLKNPDLKLDGNIQWIDAKSGMLVFC